VPFIGFSFLAELENEIFPYRAYLALFKFRFVQEQLVKFKSQAFLCFLFLMLFNVAESIMYLYRGTGDPWLVDAGLDILRSIQHSAYTPCGYATVKAGLTSLQ
jgi:hypothetical protein